ncbi:hypothetical protein [Variovorax ginsengisoli]|uniref:Uncharacterized protein n=1 Tax=Variovorax ginsengisoli TaxID=363844 RepID=A0ABT9S1S2_9BURK|nr:hypothetical protein [Variovorax ginsengisoli]MDP9898299.1 hypothetical protein [Variovorax ginsengisoli]
MTDNDRAFCTATASLLRASGTIAAWGLALSGISMTVLALTGRSLSLTSCMGFGAVVIVGVLERYLALRIRLDIGLFDALAQGTLPSLASLDGALHRLGVLEVSQAPATPRALDARVVGARHLMRRHGIAVVCQSALFLLALLTQDLQ